MVAPSLIVRADKRVQHTPYAITNAKYTVLTRGFYIAEILQLGRLPGNRLRSSPAGKAIGGILRAQRRGFAWLLYSRNSACHHPAIDITYLGYNAVLYVSVVARGSRRV